MTDQLSALRERAAALDAADALGHYRDLFVGSDDPSVVAYLDGNSLGRPLRSSVDRVSGFIAKSWGGRLIRGWDEEWMSMPLRIGDTLGEAALGAAPGQVFVGDSTTVILYKLIRAAIAARPGRSEIVVDTDNFPTDRFLLQGIAEECRMTLRWIHADTTAGVTPEQVTAVVGPQTALVVLSHVAYRSGFLADVPEITRIAHEAGALVLWDLCHSVGAVEVQLDAWGVDFAAGCSYKYLNGGPGAPAFGYVRAALQASVQQPIWGWLGSDEPFQMGPDYVPAMGIRRFISGTPAIVGMLAMQDMIALVAEAGIDAIRAKSIALTEFAIELTDAMLAEHGVTVASPRDAARRGSHVTLRHDDFRAVTAALWERGVIPDFRAPNGLRIGLSPLSTSFTELFVGLDTVRELLAQ
ncbi:kynureninase [Parafrigoribacterium humi]|uniref:kynureninase n=1 Tax=Parafrigoribacterium humi TaxID=3144664 RepID=UPI0032EE9671